MTLEIQEQKQCYYCDKTIDSDKFIGHLDNHYYQAIDAIPYNQRFAYQRIKQR